MDFDALFSGLDRHTLDGITRGSIYALVALGYTMVYGVMKLINFAHSEVFMVGTWTVLGVYTVLGATAGMGVGAVIGATVLALLAAMLASAGTALAVERIAYRPLRRKGAPPLIFLITGIGWRDCELQRNLWLSDPQRYANPDGSKQSPGTGGTFSLGYQ